jgi:hypothetical protein
MPWPREGQAAAASARRADPPVLNGNGCVPRPAPPRPAPPPRPLPRARVRLGPASGPPRAVVNPLPLAVAAAGAGELVNGARDAEAVKLIYGGALVASAGRPGWRLPLLSAAIGLRALELVRRRPTTAQVLWLAALAALRRELARAEAWDTPLSR